MANLPPSPFEIYSAFICNNIFHWKTKFSFLNQELSAQVAQEAPPARGAELCVLGVPTGPPGGLSPGREQQEGGMSAEGSWLL